MARSKCPACKKEFIKGRIALLMTTEGLKGRKVCQKCFDSGATIVHEHVSMGASPTCTVPGCKHHAVTCLRHTKKSTSEVLEPFIKLFEGQLKAARGIVSPGNTDFIDGRIDQLESTIAALKEGRT